MTKFNLDDLLKAAIEKRDYMMHVADKQLADLVILKAKQQITANMVSNEECERKNREAFEFGYSLASDNIHNEVLYYLADTKRKTIDWDWLKKRVPRTEFGDKEATYLERLAKLTKEGGA